MISVIIPTVNEEKTIAQVVSLARKSRNVDEVIVIDDKSLDRTVEMAKESGDSENDICMVRFAGIGIAFCSNNFVLNNVADYKIETKAFKNILDFAV